MATVLIRRGTLGDVPALRVLYQQLDDLHAAAEPELIPPHAMAPRAESDIRAAVEDATAPLFVATRVSTEGTGDGVVVGFARLKVREMGPYFAVPRVPDVEELAVLDGSRGTGIGRLLMDAAEAWASSEGYPELWVTAWTFNEPAMGLYRRQGFSPLSTRFRKRLPSPRAHDTADEAV